MELRVGWVGFHIEGLCAFENLLNNGTRFQAFITLDEDSISKRSAGTRKYKVLCENYNIPYYEIKNINDDSTFELLKKLSLDLIIVIGWSQILGFRVLNSAQIGCVGAHASLLPHNRGSAPVNWAIIKGEILGGNSLIWLDEGVDTGKVIGQIPIPINNYSTCKSIYDEVAQINYILLDRLLKDLEHKKLLESEVNNLDEGILPRRRPSDGAIDWSKSSCDIYNFIRGITKPYPGAFSFIEGKKWTIWSCALLPTIDIQKHRYIIGPVISPIDEACGLMVSCGSGSIVLLEIESEDGEIFKGRDLAELNWKGKEWNYE
ncbi:methionyl-tRNA formyltransferase [Lutibacter sp. B2]|nr:methionyl-tRNA formyltransferase [Lutibacter sp. B2]